ncbi:hypothetical protein BDV38DRAFT_250814 [Aspergillus pseudotamarii]|uniref:RING-type domain-containing protein n=1 Tax=Aspergillus pseudotamarii TaxID=132259 RepID=A0A5N6SN34_ASPPS|nr:uncharacterized protein BDV38DRAFT_250814 [Aspergillus pseudotamarii]KAE8135985.1 hypothetical protein BDV38DRAFT_250814 [Aspergillus pseudotamarii]
MPSPYSRPQATFLLHLSEIIELYPEEEPWCAGYAPSQGRRCHAPTNARNRKTAMCLLDEGTEDLYAGRDINDLLEDLAPYVLCTRFHKNQAPELAAKWKSRVQRFLSAYVPPATTQRAAGERRQTSTPARSRRSVEVEYPHRGKWLPTRIGEPERQRTTRSAPAASQASLINERVTQTASSTNRLYERSTSSAALPTQEMTNRTRSVASYSQTSRQVASAAVSNRRLSNIPTTAIHATSSHVRPGSGSSAALSSPTSPRSGDTTRRPIEGDCTICFDPLKQNALFGAGDGTHHGTEDEGEQQELSWCKARCGVNYHAACIEMWLKASPKSTCPTCRSAWKD